MTKRRVISIINFIAVTTAILSVLAALPFVLYLKVLPWAVSNPKVISYVENIVEKAYYVNVDIEQPYIKTSMSPEVQLGVKGFKLSGNSSEVLSVKDLDLDLSFKDILSKKTVTINSVSLDNIYADVNKVLNLPFLKQEQKPQQPCEYSVDIFHSNLAVNNIDIVYSIDKSTNVILNTKGIIHINAKYITIAVDE